MMNWVLKCMLLWTAIIILITISHLVSKYGILRPAISLPHRHHNATRPVPTRRGDLWSSEWLTLLPNHTYGDGSCGRRHSTTRLREILQRWIEIATRHNITYMLTYGSLLAALRDGDVTPWDTDIDVYTEDQDNFVLDAIQDERGFDTRSEEFHLVLDVDWKVLPVENRRRVECNGRIGYRDSCTFQGPLGRLIKGYEQYLDIWDLEVHNKGSILFDRYGPGYSFNRSDIYPLKKCMLLGLQTWCPRNPEVIFDIYYGDKADRRTPWICKNGRWLKRTKR